MYFSDKGILLEFSRETGPPGSTHLEREREIYLQELAHTTGKAWQAPSLPGRPAGWRPRGELQFTSRVLARPLFFQGHQSAFKLRPSTDCVRPTHIMEGVCVCVCVWAQSFSHLWLFATPWTIAHQAPLSMGFSRWEYWNGLLFPPPGDLPNAGIKPMRLASSALAGRFFTSAPPGNPNEG